MRVSNVNGNTYTLQDLRDSAKTYVMDVSRLREFICPPNLSPLQVAIMDENEDVADRIVDYRIGVKKRKKTYEFLVRFTSGAVLWLPYMECRELQALDVFLEDNPEAAKELNL